MKIAPFLVVALATAVAAGCGGSPQEAADSGAATSEAAASSAMPATSTLDQGPRAFESTVDEALAEAGGKLFQTKGCTACHTFGRRATGPDLAGVTKRRTAQWMEQQILHPEKMVKEDPIARELFAQFALQMTNQGLTPEEAKSVIEYLKHKDHEAAEHQ
jgi:mono/diheme cytochrome c family protein